MWARISVILPASLQFWEMWVCGERKGGKEEEKSFSRWRGAVRTCSGGRLMMTNLRVAEERRLKTFFFQGIFEQALVWLYE